MSASAPTIDDLVREAVALDKADALSSFRDKFIIPNRGMLS